MKDVFIIINGKSEHSQVGYIDVWEPSEKVEGYYESKYSAEMRLANNGYERDVDDVYFFMDEEDNRIARIVSLVKRY